MPKKNSILSKNVIVYLSTFPPRECGIATFTEDLTHAFDELYASREDSKVVALNANEIIKYHYPKKVISEIDQYNSHDYIQAAKTLNDMPKVKLINIQHEFGIYGKDGEYGSNLLEFLKEIKKPVVITFHTVLPHPNDTLKQIVIELSKRVASIVVMTKTSKDILMKDYGISDGEIKIIPHGIHPMPYTTSKGAKQQLKLSGKIVLSTFGLLSKGKGIEYGIDALPEVVKKFPNLVYLIIGATHPEVLKKEGEAYRNMLVKKVHDLGLEKNVLFFNRYLETKELLEFLTATDVYMALPLEPNQAVSGTLSYALGAGRPVISTAFAQAKEDVTSEVGILVDFRNSKQVSEALLKLLSNPQELIKMGEMAYFRTRRMEWRNVVISYMKEYIAVVPELAKREKNLPKIKLRHIIKLTDAFGMFQFAKFTKPDPKWGYTLDDNARALIAIVSYYEKFKGDVALKLAKIYLNFIEYTVEPGRNGFHNYVNYNKTFHIDRDNNEDLNDANARCFHALAYVAASDALPFDLRHKAAVLFRTHIQHGRHINSPRSLAFYIKAFSLWLLVEQDPILEQRMKDYCDYLVKLFDDHSAPNWQWFEDEMTYSNGVLPEALLAGFKKFNTHRYFEVAKATLDFLLGYSFQENLCVPIGQNGWFKRGGEKHVYDQQPEEVTALIQALYSMYEVSHDEVYKKRMHDAFNWFLGNNILSQVVYDQATGGCFDGVGEKEVNLNEGAESTVAYLIARLLLD